MNRIMDETGHPHQAQPSSGATMVEYAFLITLIALIVVAAAQFLGGSLSGQFSATGSLLGGT